MASVLPSESECKISNFLRESCPSVFEQEQSGCLTVQQLENDYRWAWHRKPLWRGESSAGSAPAPPP